LFKTIVTFFLLININSLYSEEMNIDERRLSISNSFKYIIVNKNIDDFIVKNSNDKMTNIKRSNLLKNKSLNALCEKLYNGKDSFIKNRKEGIYCYEISILEGDSKGAYFLSKIYQREFNINKSIFYYGLSLGLGGKKDQEYSRKLKNNENYNMIVKSGLMYSKDINFLKDSKREIIKNIYPIYKKDKKDPLYYDMDNHTYRNIYNLLDKNDTYNLIDSLILNENNGEKIILLAKAKSGEMDSLIEYCYKSDNEIFSEYCLKSLYLNINAKRALFYYTIKKVTYYSENLTEFSYLIGLQYNNPILQRILNNLSSKLNGDDLILLLSNYNNGRLNNEKN
jgi:hypothetical protein